MCFVEWTQCVKHFIITAACQITTYFKVSNEVQVVEQGTKCHLRYCLDEGLKGTPVAL